jgi:hypothetical protein
MENTFQANDQIRLNLLDRCFNLGLPASSKDDISTLKMYLDVDSKLEVEDFNFYFANETKRKIGIKSLISKCFQSIKVKSKSTLAKIPLVFRW